MTTDAAADDQRTFRITVRGQFAGLTDEARRYLVQAQPEHDIFVSAFTPEGTFTYDARIQFFNLRYEVRAADTAAAERAGLHEAELFLTTMKFAYKALRADVVDMSAMWDDVAQRAPRT